MKWLPSLLLLLAVIGALPAHASVVSEPPQAHAYSHNVDGEEDVALALSEAKASGRIAVIVMGANWCHDSVGLAGWLQTDRFKEMTRDRYVITYVDVGTPRVGYGVNLEIAERFGIKNLKSTPLVLMISSDGKRLNSKKDARSWRNAASRSEDDIFNYFAKFGEK